MSIDITTIDIDKVRYNPTKTQSIVLDKIEAGNDGTLTLTDPTNPFLMLMEANISLTNDALNEGIVNLRKTYPSLATKASDLYHHLSDIEAVNMYGVPSEGVILFSINMKDFLENGYVEENNISMTIPEFSTIVVNETTFTTLNDIKIIYFKDSEKISVEQLTSDNEISIKDLGVLRSDVMVDVNQNQWLTFETSVKQTKRHVIEDTIISAMGFKKEVIFTDQYYTSNVFIKNESTGNEWMKIDISHSDIVFNPAIPTIHVKVIDNTVIYTVPEIYLLNGSISGTIKIEVYDTKGKLRLNIHKLNIEDFIMTLGDTTKNESSAVSENVIISTGSREILDGGRDQRTMEELRSMIINNTTGNNILPITQNEISERASYNGFTVSKVLDVVTDRYFIANKTIPEPLDKKVKSKMDVFLNRTGLIANEYDGNEFINAIDNEKLVIRSGATFVNENNIIRAINDTEYDTLRNLSNELLTNRLSEKKHFFTPFYYITDIINGVVSTKIYDLDIPELSNVRISSKNSGDVSANVEKFTAYTDKDGFKLVFTTVGNSKFEEIDPSNVKGQLGIKLPNTEDRIYFYAIMDPVTRYLKFKIDSNFYVDENKHIAITNGFSDLTNKRIELDTEVSMIIYTDDPSVIKNKYSVTDDIIFDNDPNILALSKEYLDLSIGKELEYLWNNTTSDYTERKYETYLEDIPLHYMEDVYDVNDEGEIFTVTGTCEDGDVELDYNVLHKSGDPMLDDGGNQLYKHRKGDIKLDDKGNPIINGLAGIIRYLDILMLEYEYSLDLTVSYSNYKKNVLSLIRLYLGTNMEDLNNRMLDNTKIFYSPTRSNRDTELKVGLNTYVTNNSIKPTVTLYVTETSPIINDKISYLRGIIGMIIHKHLDTNDIDVNDIKEDIISAFGTSVRGVKIDGISNNLDLELFKVDSETTKLSIGKKLSYDVKQEIMIQYDVDIEIHKM